MVEQICSEMQRAGIFELLNKQADDDQKKAILTYIYTTFIDAFHENAIAQQSYEQLNGKVKLTRFGLRAKLVDILAWTGTGAIA
jgi:hypothetical protein